MWKRTFIQILFQVEDFILTVRNSSQRLSSPFPQGPKVLFTFKVPRHVPRSLHSGGTRTFGICEAWLPLLWSSTHPETFKPALQTCSKVFLRSKCLSVSSGRAFSTLVSLVPWQWPLPHHLPCWDSSLYPSSSASPSVSAFIPLIPSHQSPISLSLVILGHSGNILKFLKSKVDTINYQKKENVSLLNGSEWTLSFRTHPLIPIMQENCLCSFLESIIFPTLNRSNYQFKVKGSFHISKGLNVYTPVYTYERMWLNIT